MKNLLVVVISTLFFLISCNKDDSIIENSIEIENRRSLNTTKGYDKNNRLPYQDIDFRNLAKVLSIGIKQNDDLRKLIKTKALLKFDGDFDILVKHIKDREISTKSGLLTVKVYLGQIYSDLNLSVTVDNPSNSNFSTQPDSNGEVILTDPATILDYLVSVYPIIQISIPVLIEDWDAVNYSPIVTFISTDLNEGDTDPMEGFHIGTPVAVDPVLPPSEPVIVVGLCERVKGDDDGGLRSDPPTVDINLTASASATGITLAWDYENPNDEEITGYRIYRKGLNQTEFSFIFDNMGLENKTYNDNNVNFLQNYSYYVKAYNSMGEGESSNIVTEVAPDVPSAVSKFSANHFVKDEIELRWIHETGQFIENTSLFKKVVGVNSSYVEIGNFPHSVNEYFDTNVLKGKRVNYKVEENNNLGSSNPKYDFVKVPFRDVSQPSPVKVHKISYDPEKKCDEIEGWWRGQPEFRIAVVRTGSNGDPIKVQEDLEFELDHNNHEFNILLMNWSPGDWTEVLTFQVLEYDFGPDWDKNISAAFDTKDEEKKNLVKSAAEFIVKKWFDSDDEHVGRAEHRYVDEDNAILSFPVGGVKIHLSE